MATALGRPGHHRVPRRRQPAGARGVRALLALEPDLRVVGTAADYHELIRGAEDTAPQVIVTDIRMPPAFQREGIDAAQQVRKRHPGHRGWWCSPVRRPRLRHRPAPRGRRRLRLPAQGPGRPGRTARQGRPGGGRRRLHAGPGHRRGADHPSPPRRRPVPRGGRAAPAHGRRPPHQGHRRVPEDHPGGGLGRHRGPVPQLAHEATAGTDGALRRLRLLHQAIVEREQGESLQPPAAGCRGREAARRGPPHRRHRAAGRDRPLSDIRGYSSIAEVADPTGWPPSSASTGPR